MATKGHAASQVEVAKHRRYPPGPRVQGRLVPLAVETYGAPSETTLRENPLHVQFLLSVLVDDSAHFAFDDVAAASRPQL